MYVSEDFLVSMKKNSLHDRYNASLSPDSSIILFFN